MIPEDLKAALKVVIDAGLEACVYGVRDRVCDIDPHFPGSNWDHPSVIAYSDAVEVIQRYAGDGQ